MAKTTHHATIVIPPDARGQVLTEFSLSNRLANVLRALKAQQLGDLHGFTFQEISRYRNCGAVTIAELRRLIEKVCPRPPDAVPANEFFAVPDYARQFRPSDLPLSGRLTNVLERNGVARLADLRKFTPHDFKRLADCGRATRAELVRLMVRVAAGEFRPAVPSFSPTQLAPALRPLDEALAALDEDWRKMLSLYLDGDSSGPLTTLDIARRFHVTRARIGQIMLLIVEKIRKAAALRMRACLDGMADYCREQVCPFSPALFAQWLAQSDTSVPHSPVTYVWLLGKMNPALPVWLHGQGFRQMSERESEIVWALATVLRANGKALPLQEAWKLVCANLGARRPHQREFLAAVKHTKELTVDFPTPGTGIVRLQRRYGSPVRPVSPIGRDEFSRPLPSSLAIARTMSTEQQNIIPDGTPHHAAIMSLLADRVKRMTQ